MEQIPAVNEEKGKKYKRVMNVAILESRDERVKLLKSGFTGKDIETLYVILNSLDFVGVNWQKISINHDDCPVFDRLLKLETLANRTQKINRSVKKGISREI
jgi:hypothetical protein